MSRLDGPAGDPGRPLAPATDAARRRSASVTIRRQGDPDGPQDFNALMDPATRSLADALRITYRLLMLAMVVLVGLYVFSGFQSVQESERGVRLLFGRATATNLGSGFQFSWPEPFGELVRVRAAEERDVINRDFFPRITEDEERRIATEGTAILANSGIDQLDPDSDGMLLTADGNIAHARWSVQYRRSDAYRNVANVDQEFERSIVLSAVRRGIVHAAASVTVDELLTGQPSAARAEGGFRGPELIAREVAQQTLAAMDAGIDIVDLRMTARIPPRRVMPEFARVQSAQAEAGKARELALQERRGTLTRAAGEAAELLLAQIEAYERALESGSPEAARILARVDAILLGEPVVIDGEELVPRTAGSVNTLINEARNYRTAVVTEAQSRAQLFHAKLAAFEANPRVMLASDWRGAMGAFMGRDGVQTFQLPPTGDRLVLSLNADPVLAKEAEQRRLQRENQEAQEERERELERRRFTERIDAGTRVRVN